MSFVVPSRADIDEAARVLRPLVVRTPFVQSAWLSELTRGTVWLKLEFVQVTGSFRIRGAINALMRLREARPEMGVVVTASAGNHGQALALAANRVGLRARVYLPVTAPAAKRDAMRRLGAEIVETPTYEAAEDGARRDAAETGAVHISAYNHRDVIAGAGTIALEMLEDVPGLDVIVAPVGGGGLLAGTAIVAKSSAPEVGVIGAEAEASPVFTTALAAGEIVTVQVRDTLADGLAGNMEPGSQTFDLVRDLVDGVVLVAESSIELGMRELINRERLIVEGASATAVGALLQGGLSLAGRTVGVILSGRNVDGSVIARLLAPQTS